jgi:hypothetical protein
MQWLCQCAELGVTTENQGFIARQAQLEQRGIAVAVQKRRSLQCVRTFIVRCDHDDVRRAAVMADAAGGDAIIQRV